MTSPKARAKSRRGWNDLMLEQGTTMVDRVREINGTFFTEKPGVGATGAGAQILFVENIVHIEGQGMAQARVALHRVAHAVAPEAVSRGFETPFVGRTREGANALRIRRINIAGIGRRERCRPDKGDSEISREVF